MNFRKSLVPLVATFTFAACATDTVGPIKAPIRASLAVAASSGVSNYIVVTKANAKDFVASVTKLGGSVTFFHAPTGFATISGLTASAASQLRGVAGVSEVDADFVVGLDEPGATLMADGSAVLASDPAPLPGTGDPTAAILKSWQWDMHLISADTVWARGRLGSPTVTVAIIDTGLDYDNRDLRTLVDTSRSVSFSDAWVGDTTSTNPNRDTLTISDAAITATRFPTRHPIQDYNGHGTNVGATVSSRAFAFAGVTANTTLIGVKVLGRNGKGDFGQILSGVLFAADQGADIANMSLGGAFPKAGNGSLVSLINRVFNYAKQQGMLIVTSAGNEGMDLQHNGNLFSSFCDAPHVVCVSAVGPTTWLDFDAETFFTHGDAPAFYTNFGRSVISVAAPGGNGMLAADGVHLVPSDGWPWGVGPHRTSIGSAVWSFCTRTRLNIVGMTGVFGNLVRDANCASGAGLTGDLGTSQAAPHVSGLAALLIAEFGKKQPQKIKQIIESTAEPTSPLLGNGRINARRALGL
jgi:subtilisin family serine protease